VATVGRPAVLDGAGATEDGVPAGALVVGTEEGVAEPVGALLVLVLVPAVVGAVEDAVLRAALVDAGADGTDWRPPAGVVSATVGRTFR
jgi:hypothetical protein